MAGETLGLAAWAREDGKDWMLGEVRVERPTVEDVEREIARFLTLTRETRIKVALFLGPGEPMFVYAEPDTVRAAAERAWSYLTDLY